VTELLNELNKLRYIAELGDKGDVAERIGSGIQKFLKEDVVGNISEVKTREKVLERIDEYGRSLGVGRRKTASARVWIIPTKSASGLFDGTVNELPEPTEGADGKNGMAETPFIAGEVLVNHRPLSTYFQRPYDREIVLRPLRLAGLLGAYNVFARVQGGGPTGQSGAVALGLARALLSMRGEEVRDILMASMCFISYTILRD